MLHFRLPDVGVENNTQSGGIRDHLCGWPGKARESQVNREQSSPRIGFDPMLA